MIQLIVNHDKKREACYYGVSRWENLVGKFYGRAKHWEAPKIEDSGPPANLVVRFVLKTGAAVEVVARDMDEITDVWAGKMCNAVIGVKTDGTRVVIPISSVDFFEEVK